MSLAYWYSTPQLLIPVTSSHLWGDDDDSDSDEEDVYFQEDYEESFIDDDGEVGDGPGSDIDPAPPPVLHGDDEDNVDVIEVDSPAVVRQRNHQAPIVISSDEEDDYTDADTHEDYGRPWGEEEDEDVDFHDARSDSQDRGVNVYWSDGAHYDDDDDEDGDHRGFYGYL